MNSSFLKFVIKAWCAWRRSACPIFSSFCWSLGELHVPFSLTTPNHTPYYLVILLLSQRQQNNKLWCTGKWSERIAWVPDCRSPHRLKKEKFPSPFLCRDGLENLKQCKQTEVQDWSQGVDVSVTTDRKQECCWRETSAWWHSRTFLLFPLQRSQEEILKISPCPVPSPWPLSIPLLTEQGCGTSWKNLPTISLQPWRIFLKKKKKGIITFLRNSYSMCFFTVFPIFHTSP